MSGSGLFPLQPTPPSAAVPPHEAPAIDWARRDQEAALFLARFGWGDARRQPIAGDASFRRYERLSGTAGPAILMNAPPPRENVRPFLAVARLLQSLGLSVPRILAADEAAGFLLLEDFGDSTYTRLLAAGHDERQLYALAVDTLIALHRRLPQAALAALPAFDEGRALREVSLLLDWYWPAVFGGAADAAIRESFSAAWRQVLPLSRAVPQSMALFDFHVDNLMLLAERTGVAACGLLDFQDAVAGPLVLDLVSLIEDVRRDVPLALGAAMIARYRAAFPEIDDASFAAAYAVMGAQRNTRIVGTFARLLRRDGKPGYQRFMPRVWRLLEGDLAHPDLAPVAAWFAQYLPPAGRRALSTET